MKKLPDSILSLLFCLPLLTSGVVMIFCWLGSAGIPEISTPRFMVAFVVSTIAFCLSMGISAQADDERCYRRWMRGLGQSI